MNQLVELIFFKRTHDWNAQNIFVRFFCFGEKNRGDNCKFNTYL
jgi:hypothetical protein